MKAMLLALISVTVLTNTALADTCDLTDKTISAGTQSCDPRTAPSHDTCRLMKTRTRLLKDKIYYYDSVNEETGTIFYPDQTVDALTAPEENRTLYDQYLNNPRVQRMQTTIPLTVVMTHDSVKLDYSIRTHRDPRFPNDWTGSGWWIKFSFPNCYTCAVADYAEYDHVAGYGDTITQRLVKASCQIDG